MHIGEYIKYRRKSLGRTQQQIAEHLLISKQAVNKWEKCLSSPDIMLLPKLGLLLEKSPEFLAEIIWHDTYKGELPYFVLLTVIEKYDKISIIKSHEFKSFSTAANFYEKIRKGNNEAILKMLVDLFNNDNSRMFQIKLKECKPDEIGEDNGLLIDSCDITELVANYCNP